MSIPKDKKLYEKVKREADKVYKKHSAYKSGWIQKRYKELGGEYEGKKKNGNLSNWFKEKWTDVGNKEYPVYRPTVRVNRDTPLLPTEIDPKDLQEKIKEKQKIKGRRNLSPFKPKGGGDLIDIKLQVSSKYPKKKYDAIIMQGDKQKVVSFGDPNYESYEEHNDDNKKRLYIGRRSNQERKYHNDYTMPSFWSLRLLWNEKTISASIKDIMSKFPELNIFT
jgi:hypothetical protein